MDNNTVIHFDDRGKECIVDTSSLKTGMIIKIPPELLKFFEEKIKDGMLYPYTFERYGCVKDHIKMKVVGYLFKVGKSE